MNATWQNLYETLDEVLPCLSRGDRRLLASAVEMVREDHPEVVGTRDPLALLLCALAGEEW